MYLETARERVCRKAWEEIGEDGRREMVNVCVLQAEDGIREVAVTRVQTCAVWVWILGTFYYNKNNNTKNEIERRSAKREGRRAKLEARSAKLEARSTKREAPYYMEDTFLDTRMKTYPTNVRCCSCPIVFFDLFVAYPKVWTDLWILAFHLRAVHAYPNASQK